MRVHTADAAATLERVRDAGAAMVAELIPEYADDLRAYRVLEVQPLDLEILGRTVRSTPSQGGAVVQRILELLAERRDPTLADEARAVADAYGPLGSGPLPGTTHISVVDAAGMAAALSSTLGSGSGVFRGGTQLNNMLGELDVIGTHEKAAGDRLASMMTPTLVLDSGRPELVLGSAGSVRLAGAIAQVTWRILGGMHVDEAIRAPRLHVEGTTLHLEGGWPDDEVASSPAGLGRQSLGRPQPLLRRRAGGACLGGGRARGGGRPAPRRRGDGRRVTIVRPASPGDAHALVELAESVGREDGRWILGTGPWRSVADERRYLRTIERHPDAAVYVAEDGAADRRPALARRATRTPRAGTSPTSG